MKLKKITSWLFFVLMIAQSLPLSVMADAFPTTVNNSDELVIQEQTVESNEESQETKNPSDVFDDENVSISDALMIEVAIPESNIVGDFITEKTIIQNKSFKNQLEASKTTPTEALCTYTENADGTITIIDCSNPIGDIRIPSKIDGKQVSAIGDYAFYGIGGQLTGVVIPEGVISIGEEAFNGCNWLTSVSLPETLTSIGQNAFTYCDLSNITIPAGVTSIGNSAFAANWSLTSVTILGSVTSIKALTFNECESLSSITLPKSVTTVDFYAFDGCFNLTDVYYGGSKEDWEKISIGYYNDPLLNATIHFLGTDQGINITPSVVGSATLTPPADGWKEGSNTFTVSCEKACYVAISYDGGETYTRLPATVSGNAYSFTAANMDADTLIAVGIIGDVNGDGNITNADATRLRAIALGKVSLPNPTDVLGADVNNDGKLTNADATRLRAAALGKTSLSWN